MPSVPPEAPSSPSRLEALARWAPLGGALAFMLAWHLLHLPSASDRGDAASVSARGATGSGTAAGDSARRVPPASGAAGTGGPAGAAARAGDTRSHGVGPAPGLTPQQAGIGSTIEVIVARNDTLDAIFRRMALDPADLAAIRQLPGIRQSLDFLKPGDAIKVTHADGEIRTLSRRLSDTRTLEVMRRADGFQARLIDNPADTRIRTARATIDSSLFQAADAAGISDLIATKLAGIFAWDIDFVLDIRDGDRFTVVYEQIYEDGKYVRDGEILAAEFVNAGKIYRTVRYRSEDGGVGYYTPDGQPMRKAFLRAPVEFTRVSSGFNPHRRHPILDLIRGHMGTDYAAPTGTPVHVAGDGRISFAGVRGGYGNVVVVAHSNGVSTLYGHLSRFARGIHAGSRVGQGQVIAYVGMTGLATGPHLHYEYLVNGVHKNPQTVHLAGAEPLKAGAAVRFHAATAALLAALEAPPASPPTASR